MKKILTYVLCLGLLFCSGCSKQSTNKDDVLTFFDAFDHTLELNSAHIKGTMKMDKTNPYEIAIDCSFIQSGNLGLAITTDIAADENKQDDYLQFFIKDGKSYLNSMGTKTQSTIDKIGLKPESKINIINPFLSFTDDQLVSLFTSSKREGNHFTYTLDHNQLAALLDSLGTLNISKATLECDIKGDIIENLKLVTDGKQTISEETFDFEMTITLNLDQINKVTSITYPEDLDNYQN